MKTIKAEDIPATASARDFLRTLDVSQGEVVFEQNGEPRLVLVSAKMLRQRRQAKDRLFALIDEMRHRNGELNSDDVLRDLEELDHAGGDMP
jgi:hypothetical protein